MNQELSDFAARLRQRFLAENDARSLMLRTPDSELRTPNGSEPPRVDADDQAFNSFALELFALQLKHNPAYRKICAGRKLMPGAIGHWTEIPVIPTALFKELELTSIPPAERTAVFHSSGTTEQKPSRHFHHRASLELYETSLWSWFREQVVPDLQMTNDDLRLVCLAPPPDRAPHSSLVHMFETIRLKLGMPGSAFVGQMDTTGGWMLDFNATPASLDNAKLQTQNAKLILGTAFSFVHLLDYLAEENRSFQLPPGSRVMETGGYKNRSRSMPKTRLHALVTERLGVPPENIICEYGMSELSSQAYDGGIQDRVFRFPPWARVQVVSPETGQEVADGETGLIRVFDLANVFSVMAIQTEDLGIRRGLGFEWVGRAVQAEARGCSLMSA